MTLTDDQLTEAITSDAATPAAPPAWIDVVDVGRRQHRDRIGTAMIAGLLGAGLLLTAVLIGGGGGDPLETAAPEPRIVLGTESPSDRPVDPAELSGSEWRIADGWSGDEESLGAVVRFVDVDGPSRRVSIDLFCNSTVYELEWDGWTFTSSLVPEGEVMLCFDEDRDIDTFWNRPSTFIARFSDDALVIERDEVELRLVQTAFGRPNRPGVAVPEGDLLDPELLLGDWRVIDLGPGGGLLDQTGRADDIRISLMRDEVVVQHSCRSFAFDVEWSAGSLLTQLRPEEPSLAIGCETHPGLLNLLDFLNRPERIAVRVVDGQLELARSPGTERIRAMSISTG